MLGKSEEGDRKVETESSGRDEPAPRFGGLDETRVAGRAE